MSDVAPTPVPAAPERKPVDWDNLAAFLVGGFVVGLMIVVQPKDPTCLATAGAVVGGCLTYIKRNS